MKKNFTKEELALAKRLAYENWEIQDETDIGFVYCDQWITNPFLENTGRFEFSDFDAMCEFYGKENVISFIHKILASNEK